MHVKICGLTNEADVWAAVAAGADYLGFNFHAGSPRVVTAERCARLVAAAKAAGPAVKTVGVFVEQTAEEAARLLDACGLDLAHLHGGHGLEQFEALGGRAFAAVRPRPGEAVDFARLARLGPGEPAFLMDAFVPGAFGGTGVTGDWGRAAEAARQYPIFLAGGLTPENVEAAIAAVRPWGVDVASGVERTPGVKDGEKVRGFVIRAREHVGV
jgi:phosphoribosylanthranilate isomerase